jgi:hypothetical protein
MFHQRVIALFPSIERFVTEEANDIVGVGLDWIIEESGFRKLCRRQQRQQLVKQAAYIIWRQPFVRPFH